jgi:hypothetical protein
MKEIKLKNFALLNIKELDERIKELMQLSNSNIHNENDSLLEKSVKIQDRLKFIYKHDELLKLKQSLIPSEKLAEVAFDSGRCYQETLYDFEGNDPNPEVTKRVKERVLDKQKFLNSNIQID